MQKCKGVEKRPQNDHSNCMGLSTALLFLGPIPHPLCLFSPPRLTLLKFCSPFSLLPFWTFLSSLSMYIYLSALPLLLSLFTLHRSTMSKLLSVLSLLRLHFINISSSLLHLATLLLAHFKLPCSHANFCLSPRHPVWPFPESHLCLYTVLSSTSHSF